MVFLTETSVIFGFTFYYFSLQLLIHIAMGHQVVGLPQSYGMLVGLDALLKIVWSKRAQLKITQIKIAQLKIAQLKTALLKSAHSKVSKGKN